MKQAIRIATRNDIPEMVKLRSALITYARGKPISEVDVSAFRHFYEHVWDGKNPVYFVCDAADSLAGLAGQAAVSIFPALPSAKNPSGWCGYIYDVSVATSERRKGIARDLVLRVLKYSKSKGIGYVSLDATPMGEPLYRSLGFAESTHVFLELWKDGIDKLDFDPVA
jgi:ribosomal protein S18 acetylase RimI-like enzyme